MSSLPRKILRFKNTGDADNAWRMTVVEAAVLWALVAFPVPVPGNFEHPDNAKRRLQFAQRCLARWCSPEVYFRLHVYRPRSDDFWAAVKLLAVLGHCDLRGDVSGKGAACHRDLAAAMTPPLSPREWMAESSQRRSRRFYAA